MSLQKICFLFFFFFFFFFFCSSLSAPLLSPISVDPYTYHYALTLYLNTPFQPTKLLLDLTTSSTALPCSKPTTPPTKTDDLALPTTDGRNPGKLAVLPESVFSCSEPHLLKGLAKGFFGLAGFGHTNFSLPAQVCTAFSLPHLFALCLSGSPSAPGVAFFGSGGPYIFLPETDLSQKLVYTPLISNPVRSVRTTKKTYSQPSDGYFIGVRSIKVNGKVILLNGGDESGYGGAELSTAIPYTVLKTSVYKSFTRAFVRESAALNLTVTKPVKPFRVCYPADDVMSTRLGPAVPTVDLVMESEDVFWRIFGWNSMVRIARKDAEVWCLGFLDGGSNPTTDIVIGGHQMEDNLLQFDVGNNKLGFSSSVLAHGTTCSNFNFTINNNLK